MDDAPLTPQGIFDEVVRGLAAQGGPSTNTQGHCRYRALNGRKCAVGLLIRDDEYRPDMEDNNVDTLHGHGFLPGRFFPFLNLLFDLQKAHDNASIGIPYGGKWIVVVIRRRLAFVASQYDLSSAVIDEAFPNT